MSNNYDISDVLELSISDSDLLRARTLFSKELITPVTDETLFQGVLYSLLSVREKYSNQIKVYNSLIRDNLATPKNILERSNELYNYSLGLDKSKYIVGLAKWWIKSNISKELIEDMSNGKSREFELRDMIANEADGISYKCSSLFMNMCGYENVVTLDVWAMRALVSAGYDVKSYKYVPRSSSKNLNRRLPQKIHTYLGRGIYLDRGLTSKKEYYIYESNFRDLAGKFGLTPINFKQVLWVKRSTWTDVHDELQLKLEF
jgi:thermostable 8-oxoguanine DNA glycosylase